MRTIIAGSRHLEINLAWISYGLLELVGGKPSVVLCGECPSGADAAGKQWAHFNGVPVQSYPADWQEHGRYAGPLRNREMAANAQALLLLWDGYSRGSANMLKEAQRHALRIHEILL